MIVEPTNPPIKPEAPQSDKSPETTPPTQSFEQPKGAPQFGVPISAGNPKIHKTHNRRPFIIALILVLLIGGGLYYWFNIRSEPAKNSQSQQSAQSDSQKQKVIDKVFYLSRTGLGDESTMTLYSNGADGKSETAIEKYPSSASGGKLDESETEILFSIESNLYYLNKYSTDKPTRIINYGKGKRDIIDAKFSPKDSKLIYLSITYDYSDAASSQTSSSEIKSIALDGKNEKTIYKGKSAALFVSGWDFNIDKVYARDNCWQCDGFSDINSSFAVNLSDGTRTEETPFDNFEKDQISSSIISNDGKSLLYYQNTIDKTLKTSNESGFDNDYYVGAPFELISKDLAANKPTTISSYGEKKVDEANYPLTFQKHIYLGFNGKFYNSFQESLYDITDNKTALLITTGDKNPIFRIDSVDENYVVATVQTNKQPDPPTFETRVYNLKDKAETLLTKSDGYNTDVLGVSTKEQ